MPLPTGSQTFTYKPVAAPILSGNPAQAKPIGVGAIANGGNTFDITIGLDRFAGPVDVLFGVYASSIDATNVFFFNSSNSLQTSRDSEGRQVPRSRLVWKTSVLDVTDALAVNVPVSALPAGQYILILQVSPTATGGDDINSGAYDRWITRFTIKSGHQSDDDD